MEKIDTVTNNKIEKFRLNFSLKPFIRDRRSSFDIQRNEVRDQINVNRLFLIVVRKTINAKKGT